MSVEACLGCHLWICGKGILFFHQVCVAGVFLLWGLRRPGASGLESSKSMGHTPKFRPRREL